MALPIHSILRWAPATGLGKLLVLLLFCALTFQEITQPNPYRLLAMIGVFSLDWLAFRYEIIPRQITWLSELIVITLFVRAMSSIATERSRRFRLSPPVFWSLTLIVIATLSAVLNTMNALTAILGMRNYLKYMLLFFSILILPIKITFLRKMMFLILSLIILQIPAALFQKLQWWGHSGDFVAGTLGRYTSGYLGMTCLIGVSFLIAFYMTHQKRLWYLLFAGLLILVPAISETKAAVLLWPFIIVVMLRREIRRSPFRFAVWGLFLLILFLGTNYIFDYLNPKKSIYTYIAAPQKIVKYESIMHGEEYKGMGRFQAMGFIWGELKASPLHLFLGVGPGNASESFFEAYSGSYFRLYPFKVVVHTASLLLFELGFLGLATTGLLLLSLVPLIRKIERQDPDPFWRAFASASFGALFVFFFSAIYVYAIFGGEAITLIFWLVAATLIKRATELAEGLHNSRTPSVSKLSN